jgi:hypothetical protein
MVKTRSLRIAILAGALAAVVAVGSTVASDGNRTILEGKLAGLPASLTSTPTAPNMFMGAIGGGAPWRIASGEAKLSSGGQLEVQVEGLVLAAGPRAGTNPVPTGRALVSCSGAVVAMSDSVPFSPTGDAEVDTMVSLPASCLAPVIFFAGDTAGGPRWFAVTGF